MSNSIVKIEALSRASQALSQLGIPERLAEFSARGFGIKRSTLGGSHSVVTYPPLDALQPMSVDCDSVTLLQYGGRAHLYLHIPFCETECTFCHYAVEHYRGAEQTPHKIGHVERYLEALRLELRMWGQKFCERGTVVSSVYIGGGTPLVLETVQIEQLLNDLRREFTLVSDVEICLEGSPLTIVAGGGADKLSAIASLGVTRFSFGVQSFNATVLHYAARGHGQDIAQRACQIVNGIFPNWNLDLIQGLRQGSPDEVWENLEVLAKIRPPHITWYHGRFAKHRPQGEWYQLTRLRSELEYEYTTLHSRMLIWQELERLGYIQIDGNRFVREARYIDPFKSVRTSVSDDLLGLGVSAYSHAADVFTRNTTDIGEYIRRVLNQSSAIKSSLALTADERFAASFVIGLRTERWESAQSDDSLVDPVILRHYKVLVAELMSLGLLEEISLDGGRGLTLSRLGRLYEDEVLALFYSPAVLKSLRQT